MKPLIDANISRRVVRQISEAFPGVCMSLTSGSVSRRMMLSGGMLVSGFAILTKDADFNQLAFLRGQPPKVVRVRAGTATTAEMASIVMTNTEMIQRFGESHAESLLVIPVPNER